MATLDDIFQMDTSSIASSPGNDTGGTWRQQGHAHHVTPGLTINTTAGPNAASGAWSPGQPPASLGVVAATPHSPGALASHKDELVEQGYSKQVAKDYTAAYKLYTQAISLFEREEYPLDTQKHDVLFSRALCACMLEPAYDQVLSDLAGCISLKPDDPSARLFRSLILMGQDKLDPATSDLDQIVSRTVGVEPAITADALAVRAILHHKRAQWNRAIEDCNRSLLVKPRSAMALVVRGDTYKYMEVTSLHTDRPFLEDYTQAMASHPQARSFVGRGFKNVTFKDILKFVASISATFAAVVPRPSDAYNGSSFEERKARAEDAAKQAQEAALRRQRERDEAMKKYMETQQREQERTQVRDGSDKENTGTDRAQDSHDHIHDNQDDEVSRRHREQRATRESQARQLEDHGLAFDPDNVTRAYRRPWAEPIPQRTSTSAAQRVINHPVRVRIDSPRRKYRRAWAEPTPTLEADPSPPRPFTADPSVLRGDSAARHKEISGPGREAVVATRTATQRHLDEVAALMRRFAKHPQDIDDDPASTDHDQGGRMSAAAGGGGAAAKLVRSERVRRHSRTGAVTARPSSTVRRSESSVGGWNRSTVTSHEVKEAPKVPRSTRPLISADEKAAIFARLTRPSKAMLARREMLAAEAEPKTSHSVRRPSSQRRMKTSRASLSSMRRNQSSTVLSRTRTEPLSPRDAPVGRRSVSRARSRADGDGDDDDDRRGDASPSRQTRTPGSSRLRSRRPPATARAAIGTSSPLKKPSSSRILHAATSSTSRSRRVHHQDEARAEVTRESQTTPRVRPQTHRERSRKTISETPRKSSRRPVTVNPKTSRRRNRKRKDGSVSTRLYDPDAARRKREAEVQALERQARETKEMERQAKIKRERLRIKRMAKLEERQRQMQAEKEQEELELMRQARARRGAAAAGGGDADPSTTPSQPSNLGPVTPVYSPSHGAGTMINLAATALPQPLGIYGESQSTPASATATDLNSNPYTGLIESVESPTQRAFPGQKREMEVFITGLASTIVGDDEDHDNDHIPQHYSPHAAMEQEQEHACTSSPPAVAFPSTITSGVLRGTGSKGSRPSLPDAPPPPSPGRVGVPRHDEAALALPGPDGIESRSSGVVIHAPMGVPSTSHSNSTSNKRSVLSAKVFDPFAGPSASSQDQVTASGTLSSAEALNALLLKAKPRVRSIPSKGSSKSIYTTLAHDDVSRGPDFGQDSDGTLVSSPAIARRQRKHGPPGRRHVPPLNLPAGAGGGVRRGLASKPKPSHATSLSLGMGHDSRVSKHVGLGGSKWGQSKEGTTGRGQVTDKFKPPVLTSTQYAQLNAGAAGGGLLPSISTKTLHVQ